MDAATSQVYFMFIGILKIHSPRFLLNNLYVAPEGLF